ncbi:MAG: hypothetical protein MJ025_05310 [Victivallaceae bacterium]|nr:hypothetical protein [Victivallaceae bacterium]
MKKLIASTVATLCLSCLAVADNVENRFRIPSGYPAPRQVLLEHFEKTRHQLPIEGGWGYSLDDAVVIKTEDPDINPGKPFFGIAVENVFIHYRIREELEYASKEKYHCVNWTKTGQRLVFSDGRPYDVISYVVEAMPQDKWDELCNDYDAHNGYRNDPDGLARLDEKRKALTERFEEEAYMDISTWFGSY